MAARSSLLLTRLVTALERGLPPALLAASEARRRALLVSGTAWVIVIACVFTIPVLLATTSGPGRVVASLVNATTAGLALGAIFLLRHRSVVVAAHWLTALTFVGMLFVVAISGSLTSPYWVLLVAVPFLAAEMAGRVAGHVWTAVCLAGVATFWALDRLGVELPRLTDPGAHTNTVALYTAMAVLAVHVLSYLAEVARDEAIGRAEQAAVQLAQADSEVEEARILAERAVAASAAKSAFMATMSHELRTPLNAVIGYAELLVEDAESSGLRTMREDLEKILGASHHLCGLIEGILDLSRVEADKLDLKREVFAAQDVVHEVVLALGPLARRRGNVLAVDCLDAPIRVDLDRGRVRQVLVNLLGNAIKFTSQGRVGVAVALEAGALVVTIEDTGIGISADDLKRIFDPFTQVDASPRRRYEGSGLGLSLCKRLAELMGGSLRVRSELGRGSSFTLRLPALPSSA
jgi:signal transduction histidine kinase